MHTATPKALLVFLSLSFACSAKDTAASPDGGDLAALSILSITPDSNEIGVMLFQPIVLEFSEAPQGDIGIELVSSADGLPILHTTSVDGSVVTLEPTNELPLATRVDIRVPAGALSASGAALGSEFRSHFDTRDGEWTTTELYRAAESNAVPLGNGVGASLEVSKDGSALVAFRTFGAGPTQIIDRSFAPSTGWGSEHQEPAPGVQNIDIAATSLNNAVMLHESYTGGGLRVHLSRWASAGRSAVLAIDNKDASGVSKDQYMAGVAVNDSSSAFTFHRGDFDADEMQAFLAIQTATATEPSTPIRLGQNQVGETYLSKIASNGMGGYVVAWVQHDNTDFAMKNTVWSATIGPDGTVGTPTKIDEGFGEPFDVELEIAQCGNRVQLAWTLESRGNEGRKLRVGSKSLSSNGPTLDVTLEFFDFFRGEQLALACRSEGAMVVVTSTKDLFAAVESSGQWGALSEVFDGGSGFDDRSGLPRVTLDARGNGVIAWTQFLDAGGRRGYLARVQAGQWAPGDALGKESSVVYDVGIDSNGRVTATWGESDGASSVINANHFD